MANKPLEGCCLKLTSTGFYEMSKVCCVLRRFSSIDFISAAPVRCLVRGNVPELLLFEYLFTEYIHRDLIRRGSSQLLPGSIVYHDQRPYVYPTVWTLQKRFLLVWSYIWYNVPPLAAAWEQKKDTWKNMGITRNIWKLKFCIYGTKFCLPSEG